MKKLFAVLVTMMAVSTVFACPGGNLIQVVIQKGSEKILAATIDKKTGHISLGQQVASVGVFNADGLSICADKDGGCTKLEEISEKDLMFIIKMKDKTNRLKSISEVTINSRMAVPKGGFVMPGQVLGENDSGGELIYNCSTKN